MDRVQPGYKKWRQTVTIMYHHSSNGLRCTDALSLFLPQNPKRRFHPRRVAYNPGIQPLVLSKEKGRKTRDQWHRTLQAVGPTSETGTGPKTSRSQPAIKLDNAQMRCTPPPGRSLGSASQQEIPVNPRVPLQISHLVHSSPRPVTAALLMPK